MADYNEYLKYLKHVEDTTKQDVEAKIDEKNIEITKLKKDFNIEKQKLESSLKTEIDGLNNYRKRLEISIANLNEEKSNLTTELNSTKEELKYQIEQKEIEVKNATTNSSVLKTQKTLNAFLWIFVVILTATTLFFAITMYQKMDFIDKQDDVIKELTESNNT
jgi:chromosome segregation ATPase